MSYTYYVLIYFISKSFYTNSIQFKNFCQVCLKSADCNTNNYNNNNYNNTNKYNYMSPQTNLLNNSTTTTQNNNKYYYYNNTTNYYLTKYTDNKLPYNTKNNKTNKPQPT